MNNCLVLQGISEINNSYAREAGEIRVRIVNPNGGGVTLLSASPNGTKVKILTPGVTFTNQSHVGDTEQTVSNQGARNCTVNGACEIAIYDKYNVARLEDSSYYLEMDINELDFANNMTALILKSDSALTDSVGDIEVLKGMTLLTNVFITCKNVTGDIANLPEASGLWELAFASDNGSRHANIYGDIANIPNKLPAIVDVKIAGTKVSGSVESFSGKSQNLRDVFLSYCKSISGQISGFANHSALRSLQIYGSGVTGNLGQLVNVPALKGLWLPDAVTYTAADAARIDALLQSNGATVRPDGHYFAGGTLVENY